MSRASPFGPATTGLKRLIRREVQSRSQLTIGTVVSSLKMFDDDGLGSSTWVCDVAVGRLRVLRDVQVKAGANGSRFYASLGQTVSLARNTQGRFDVVGPGDRLAAIAVVKTYTLGNPTPVSTSDLGFQVYRAPFEYYQGAAPPPTRWNDGTTAFPYTEIQDADGNPV